MADVHHALRKQGVFHVTRIALHLCFKAADGRDVSNRVVHIAYGKESPARRPPWNGSLRVPPGGDEGLLQVELLVDALYCLELVSAQQRTGVEEIHTLGTFLDGELGRLVQFFGREVGHEQARNV